MVQDEYADSDTTVPSKIEQRLNEHEGMIAKLRVDTQSGFDTLKNDFDKKLTVMEAKTDMATAACEKNTSLCEEILKAVKTAD